MSANLKFFAQRRPVRARVNGVRVLDHSTTALYVCAHWRTKDGDTTKQQGCSVSAERYGLEKACRIAADRARKKCGVQAQPRNVFDGLIVNGVYRPGEMQ